MKNKEEYISKQNAYFFALGFVHPDELYDLTDALAIDIREQTPADVVEKDIIKKVIEEIENEHPYKILGEYNTYNDYHQGWSDACDRILCSLLDKEYLEER